MCSAIAINSNLLLEDAIQLTIHAECEPGTKKWFNAVVRSEQSFPPKRTAEAINKRDIWCAQVQLLRQFNRISYSGKSITFVAHQLFFNFRLNIIDVDISGFTTQDMFAPLLGQQQRSMRDFRPRIEPSLNGRCANRAQTDYRIMCCEFWPLITCDPVAWFTVYQWSYSKVIDRITHHPGKTNYRTD